MSTLTVPTLAERLQHVPDDRLYVRLDVARVVFSRASTPESRARAMYEIDCARDEILRRGLKVYPDAR